MKASSAAQFSSLSPEDVPRAPSADIIELFAWQNIFQKLTVAFPAKHPVLSHPLSALSPGSAAAFDGPSA